MHISGFVARGYEQLRDVFTRLVADGRETGAALSVWADGTEVVGLTGGWADSARSRPWRHDTLVHTYSVSKPFASLAALTAVADGTLRLDEPVSAYWAEYGTGGKNATTLRQILTHRAGLPAFPPSAATLDLLDQDGLLRSLAAAPAKWEPGSRVAEHALTYGHLIDGVLRAGTGRSLGEVYADVVRPALNIDAWFGVPERDLDRVADVEHALPGAAEQILAEVYPSYGRVLAAPTGALDPSRLNSVGWRRAVFGAINLHASASALAAFYGSLTSPDGPVRRLLGHELHDEYLTTQVCGTDDTVGRTLAWTLGPLRTDAIIGLGGLGGSAAWWSLRHGHAVAYVTRRLHDHSRVAEIAAALDDDINTEVRRP
ncbi:serine hydrolase domain-containing protein [Pseudonocardia kunmingensis]|uniref:CubicO group peptidase (Beta-lactamase class C family) n=1 Tax=Pseudonocardia kunmingensis TaxID=630975 RepID=A0A543DKM7_9PSEU|nr:serine hydrolase domain-containing protein [Pseudonocardia kunmingensis]TQM09887.1 CubicO group peptidase (beta-lactamase class C family) [Pseudonocardia kunmingensis]